MNKKSIPACLFLLMSHICSGRKASAIMILIADSGSTKCDWAHLSYGGKIKKFQTLGLNPQIQSKSFLEALIHDCSEFTAIANDIQQAYLYVSGCSTNEHRNIISNAMSSRFPNIQEIQVENDLKGAARACLGNNEGLVAILGTGSNLAWFDGDNLSFKTPALGYVLGDEGSGNQLGKSLIVKRMYHQLPSELATLFDQKFRLSKDQLLQKVYQEERPNAFLASFVPFLVEHQKHPFIEDMITQNFEAFIQEHIFAYPKEQRTRVNFVGSIPVYLETPLRKALQKHDIAMGRCVAKPIEQLINYHK